MARGKAIDEKIRSIIVKLSNEGNSYSEIGKLLDISRYSVRNVIKYNKKHSSVTPQPRNIKKSKLTDNDRRALKRIIKQNRRANYGQLSVLWSDAVGRRVSRSTCHREAKKLGFGSYKVTLLKY